MYFFHPGLQIGGCGTVGVRFRPALIYTEDHVGLTLDLLDRAMSKVIDSRKRAAVMSSSQ